MPSISTRNLTFAYNIEKPIFKDVSFTISPKEKVAIMGQNGSGKSTLCKIFAKQITEDILGEVRISKHTSLAYAGQQMPKQYFHWTIQDFLLDAKGLKETLKNYYLVLDLLAFDTEFENYCKNKTNTVETPNLGVSTPDNISTNNNLNTLLKNLDHLIHTTDLPELNISEEKTVELIVELEEETTPTLIQTQTIKFLNKCPNTEKSLTKKEFMHRFQTYFEYLKQKSLLRYHAKTHYMQETLNLLGDLQELYELKNGHDIEEGIRKVLTLVGLEKLDTNLPISMLSGGQKTRLTLAQAIFKEPDILILDEPTNNLDKYAYSRLVQFVQNFKNTLIVISHDAWFLEQFVDKVLYIDIYKQTIREYHGTYRQVEAEVAAQMEREKKALHKINKEIKSKNEVYNKRAQQAKIYDSKALAQNVKQLKNKITKLENSKVDKLQEDRTISNFTLPSQTSDDPLFGINQIGKWDGEKSNPITFNFEAPEDAFILLSGDNGIGKSWFLKEAVAYAKALEVQETDTISDTIYQELNINPKHITKQLIQILKNHQKNQLWTDENNEACGIKSECGFRSPHLNQDISGKKQPEQTTPRTNAILNQFKQIANKTYYQPQVKLGYYSQDFATLNFDNTIQKEMETVHPFKYEELRSTLARFLFHSKQLNQQIKELSEGQKALLSWAKLSFAESNILFLDEPTNHINFRHLPIILESLKNYKGTILLVCHDESFVKQLPITHILDLNTEKMWKWKEWKKR